MTGSDVGAGATGVAFYDVYVSINGAPFALWTTLPASSPAAIYSGSSNHSYGFYSIAHDVAEADLLIQRKKSLGAVEVGTASVRFKRLEDLNLEIVAMVLADAADRRKSGPTAPRA